MFLVDGGGEQDFNISRNPLFAQCFLDVLGIFVGLPGPARIPDLARSGAPVFFPRSGRPEPGLARAARRHPFLSPPRAGPGMPVGLPLILTKCSIFYWFYKVFCILCLRVESSFDQNTLFSPVF